MKSIVYCLCFLFGVAAAASQITVTQCEEHQSPLYWKSCITKAENGVNRNVLYYFHGAWENEHAWDQASYAPEIYKSWAQSDFTPPIVVSISFGDFWALREKAGDPRSGLLEAVTEEIIPSLEAKLGVKPKKRFFLGHSMGGYNVIQLVMKTPNVVTAAAMVCPALWTITPWSSLTELTNYWLYTGAEPKYVLNFAWSGKSVFHDEQSWWAGDPLVVGAAFLNRKSPPMYMSWSEKDGFGFWFGSEKFIEMVQKQEATLQYQRLPGGHCEYTDAKAIANFFREH